MKLSEYVNVFHTPVISGNKKNSCYNTSECNSIPSEGPAWPASSRGFSLPPLMFHLSFSESLHLSLHQQTERVNLAKGHIMTGGKNVFMSQANALKWKSIGATT